jgi:hypothetical protein
MENSKIKPVSLKEIRLGRQGGLTPGTKFINNDTEEEYVVEKSNGDYVIKSKDGCQIEITYAAIIL